MADQFKWQEMDDHEVIKKRTIIKAATIMVILFIGLLVVNDFVFYRYVSNLNASETRPLPSLDEKKSTTPG